MGKLPHRKVQNPIIRRMLPWREFQIVILGVGPRILANHIISWLEQVTGTVCLAKLLHILTAQGYGFLEYFSIHAIWQKPVKSASLFRLVEKIRCLQRKCMTSRQIEQGDEGKDKQTVCYLGWFCFCFSFCSSTFIRLSVPEELGHEKKWLEKKGQWLGKRAEKASDSPRRCKGQIGSSTTAAYPRR